MTDIPGPLQEHWAENKDQVECNSHSPPINKKEELVAMDVEKAGVLSVFLAPVFTGSQVSHVSGVAEAAGSDWASEVPPTVGEEQV